MQMKFFTERIENQQLMIKFQQIYPLMGSFMRRTITLRLMIDILS